MVMSKFAFVFRHFMLLYIWEIFLKITMFLCKKLGKLFHHKTCLKNVSKIYYVVITKKIKMTKLQLFSLHFLQNVNQNESHFDIF